MLSTISEPILQLIGLGTTAVLLLLFIANFRKTKNLEAALEESKADIQAIGQKIQTEIKGQPDDNA
jgi:hypothetical protein